jgi:hypothetical protein
VANVGSTCIKDFLGWDANVVFYSEKDITDEFDMGSAHYAPIFTVETVLAYAHAATRAFGWVPASSYHGKPTADWVRLALGMYRPTKDEEARLREMSQYVAEATERAAVVRDFVLSDAFAGTSTYVDNLKASCAEQVITSKQIGLVASAPQAYIRHLETAAEREAREASYRKVSETSDFVGAVKDKVTVEGTIKAIRYISGQYGTTTLYSILSTEGNLFKWFSTNGALGDAEGVTVKIQGTVKGHEEYNGTKATMLTRCKAI